MDHQNVMSVSSELLIAIKTFLGRLMHLASG